MTGGQPDLFAFERGEGAGLGGEEEHAAWHFAELRGARAGPGKVLIHEHEVARAIAVGELASEETVARHGSDKTVGRRGLSAGRDSPEMIDVVGG